MDIFTLILGALVAMVVLTDPPRSQVITRPEPDTDRPTERKVG